jgi:hypothetical protein
VTRLSKRDERSDEMKILPYDAALKIVSNIQFIKAGFLYLMEKDIVDVTDEPESIYYKDHVENVVTLRIRFKTEYVSEQARQAMEPYIKEEDNDPT